MRNVRRLCHLPSCRRPDLQQHNRHVYCAFVRSILREARRPYRRGTVGMSDPVAKHCPSVCVEGAEDFEKTSFGNPLASCTNRTDEAASDGDEDGEGVETASSLHCVACPPGGHCPGGKLATVFAGKDRWIDTTRRGTPVVFACFSDHCSAANGSQSCVAGDGRGCCGEGRHGLLCESCTESYTKQNDRCVPCTGAEWATIVQRMFFKTLVISFLCTKLLEKATIRTCAMGLAAQPLQSSTPHLL